MQKKTVLFVAVSLDGFIADDQCGVTWLSGHNADYRGDNGYSDFLDQVDTVVMGRTTYEQIVTELSPGEWPYPGKNCFVFTHQAVGVRCDDPEAKVVFVSEDIQVWLERIRHKHFSEGGLIWICGGADLANQFLAADLIDEYYLNVFPVILGKGTPLFRQDNPQLRVRLKSLDKCNGIVTAIYERERIMTVI